jgi:hypothetical protein
MKIFLIVTIALTVLAAIAYSQLFPQRAALAQLASSSADTRPETGFYCDRLAIKPEQRARKAELDKTLRSSIRHTRELDDGFEFEFAPDPATFQIVAEWAAMERSCCPFFEIDLRLQREGGPFFFRLTGREGVKQFIKNDFGRDWFRN